MNLSSKNRNGIGLLVLLCVVLSLNTQSIAQPNDIEKVTEIQLDKSQIGEDEEGFGEDEEGFGEDEEGFGEDEFADLKIKIPKTIKKPSPLRIDGFLRSQWAVWNQRFATDPWAKGRQNLDISVRYSKKKYKIRLDSHVEYDTVYLSDQTFNQGQVDDYQFQWIQGEQYVAYFWKHIELFVGRQIVAWGEGDALSTLDQLNPRDQREPGVADIDDIRLAVLMTRIKVPMKKHEIEFIVRHEGNYGLLVSPLADYSPFRTSIPPEQAQLLSDLNMQYQHDREGISADTQSFFLRWLYRGEGLDLGLYAAYLNDLQGAINLDPNALFRAILEGATTLKLPYTHPHFYLLGASSSFAVKSFVIKTELSSYLDRVSNVGNPETFDLSTTRINTINTLLSITYNGVKDLTLGFEYQHGILLSDVNDLLIPPTMPLFALRATQVLLRERLNLNLVASLIDPQWSADHTLGIHLRRGGLVRVDALYKITDQVHAQLGYIHYMTGDDFGPFYGLSDHDRIFGQIRWNFTLY